MRIYRTLIAYILGLQGGNPKKMHGKDFIIVYHWRRECLLLVQSSFGVGWKSHLFVPFLLIIVLHVIMFLDWIIPFLHWYYYGIFKILITEGLMNQSLIPEQENSSFGFLRVEGIQALVSYYYKKFQFWSGNSHPDFPKVVWIQHCHLIQIHDMFLSRD